MSESGLIEWFHPAINQAIPAVISLFGHPEWPVRQAAVSAFGYMAQKGQLFIPQKLE
jgi:HEAT repeat protein